MNERIQELATQVGLYVNLNGRLYPQQFGAEALDDIYQKFAELIVRECARIIDRGDGEMSSMAETIWCNVCRDDILKHFGVEE